MKKVNCCKDEKLRRAYIIIFGIKFPAVICENCFEVTQDAMSIPKTILLIFLSPFWNGSVAVDKQVEEKMKYI